MNVSRTIYCGFKSSTNEFDVGRFVEAVLLFDTVLLSDPSVLPELIRAAGSEGVLRLLENGLLGVVGGGPSAQGTYDFKSPGFFSNRPLDRPLRYGFETIFVDPGKSGNPSAEERLERDIKKAKEIVSINDKDLSRIHEAILPSMKVIDGRSLKTGDDFQADLNSKHDFIVGLLVDYLSRELQLPVHGLNWRVNIEEVSEDIYHIDSNLDDLLKINQLELHELFKKPFFEITGTNLPLHRMRAVNAAAGLTETQTYIISKRVDFLSRVHAESDTRPKFTKILEIADVPTLAPGSTLNVDELIKLRESDVARAFRDWIQHSQTLDESDIRVLIGGWRKKLGEMLKFENMRGIRWLTSTGIGAIIGPGTGVIVSGLDYFLDKFLSGMGPIGFVVVDYSKYIQQQNRKK